MKNVVKDEVIKEIRNELNWREKIIVKLFKNTFVKIYNITRVVVVNKIL